TKAGDRKDIDNQDRSLVDAQYQLTKQSTTTVTQPQNRLLTKATTESWKTGSSVTPSEGDGIYKLMGRTEDKATNISALTEEKTIKVDTTAPKIESVEFLTLSNQSLPERIFHTIFGFLYNGTTKVVIKTSDAGSGVEGMTYRIGDGEAVNVSVNAGGTGTFYVDPSVDGKLTITATDRAGHQTTSITENLKLEVEKPIVSIEPIEAPNAVDWYKDTVDYTVKVKDADAGLSELKLYLTEGSDLSGKAPFETINYTEQTNNGKKLITGQQTYDRVINQSGSDLTVTAVATDNAGNVRTQSKAFKIERSVDVPALTATMTVPDPTSPAGQSKTVAYDHKVTSSAVTTTLDFAEPISGVSALEYA
ncbi:MAG: hypothetical protein RR614_14265, partial [Eubacterium sp.]